MKLMSAKAIFVIWRNMDISYRIKIIHIDKKLFSCLLKLRPTTSLYLPSTYFKIINHNWEIVY